MLGSSFSDILITRNEVDNVESIVKFTLIWISHNNVNAHNLLPELFEICDMQRFVFKKRQDPRKSKYC